MNDSEFRKYVELIMSMSTDYLMGSCSKKNYVNNLDMMIENMMEKKRNELPKDNGYEDLMY